jgi:phosphoribosylformylglycinamidine cyclo-ligase
MSVDARVEEFGRTLGEELLEPTRIYVRTVKNLRRDLRITGIAHITGGGITDNLPRILPKRCKAVINTSSWTPPPIFGFLQENGKLSQREMMRTFNNGIGLIVVVSENHAGEALSRLKAMGETAYPIGIIEARGEREEPIQFTGG